jgi:hypothetical protein
VVTKASSRTNGHQDYNSSNNRLESWQHDRRIGKPSEQDDERGGRNSRDFPRL